jgi:hypothetical protein
MAGMSAPLAPVLDSETEGRLRVLAASLDLPVDEVAGVLLHAALESAGV